VNVIKIFVIFTLTLNGEACLLKNSKVANLLSVMLLGYIQYPQFHTSYTFGNGVAGIVIMLQSTSRILRLEPASQAAKVWASDCQV